MDLLQSISPPSQRTLAPPWPVPHPFCHHNSPAFHPKSQNSWSQKGPLEVIQPIAIHTTSCSKSFLPLKRKVKDQNLSPTYRHLPASRSCHAILGEQTSATRTGLGCDRMKAIIFQECWSIHFQTSPQKLMHRLSVGCNLCNVRKIFQYTDTDVTVSYEYWCSIIKQNQSHTSERTHHLIL